MSLIKLSFKNFINSQNKIVIFLLLTSFIFDLLTIFSPGWGKLGILTWLMMFIVIFKTSLEWLKDLIKGSFKHKTFFTLLSLAIFCLLIFYHASNRHSLSGETAMEINCFLNHLRNAEDAGFHQTCLFEYPAKQFLIPSLPSLVFGRDLFALNIGGSIYLLLGVFMLATALFSMEKDTKKTDILAGISVICLLHFYYFNFIAFTQFEQSIFPLSFGLGLVGLYLKFEKVRNPKYLLIAGIVLQFLIYSYTTSLALIGLAVVYLIWELASSKNNQKLKKYLAFIIITTIVGLIISFNIRGDVKLTSDNRTISDYWPIAKETAEILLFRDTVSPWTSPLLYVLMVFSILKLLTKPNIKKISVILWITATTLASTFMVGYASPPAHFALYRFLIAVPVLITMIYFFLANLKLETKFLIMIYFFVLATGLNYHLQYFRGIEASSRIPFFKWLATKVDIKKKAEIDLSSIDHNDFLSMNDTMQYFLPNLEQEQLITDPNSCSIESRGLYVFPDNHWCQSRIMSNSKVQFLGKYQYQPALTINLFQVK
ncbi:MAG: hypothetical protein ACOZAN_01340 [Patescibacteria group bacterium]